MNSPSNSHSAPASFPPPRSAYIHVPFCARRCGYCSFTVLAAHEELVEPYLEAIARELSWLDCPREVDTLFIGGGTPTRLNLDQLRRLLALVVRWFPPAAGHEFTVEANPTDLTADLVDLLLEHRVTRISLGAQSLDPVKLRRLERDHGPADVLRAIALARRFPSVAMDLIFAAPGETFPAWTADLAAALRLAPNHFSVYGLTYERGAAFWGRRRRGQLAQADEEMERAMYAEAIDRLAAAGYEHYEVSNFALPGHRCRHNEVYWTGGSYFAAGPGAARYVDGCRQTNHRSTRMYLKRVLAGQSPVVESETLEPEDRARETLVFGLRRLEGIDRAEFAARTGFEVEALVGEALRRYVEAGFLEADSRHIRLSREGLFVSDAIWPSFLA
ncbi:MAG: radical SAM family heme chaperone HemW [Pirellulales bacterium]